MAHLAGSPVRGAARRTGRHPRGAAPLPSPRRLRRRRRARRRKLGLLAFRARVPRLGPAHLPPSTVAEDPFSSSVLGARIRVAATATKICTGAGSTRARARASAPPPRPPTRGRASDARKSAIHFRSSRIRWVRRNTFLSGCRPPWLPPHCLDSPASLRPCAGVGLLIPPRGSSLLASPAYQNRPTGPGHSRAFATQRAPAHSEFASALPPLRRHTPSHSSTAQNCARPAVLRDISEGTSYQTVRLVFRPYTQVARSI